MTTGRLAMIRITELKLALDAAFEHAAVLDLEVARELGVDCALIAAGHHPFERLHASGAPVFADLAAFAAAYGL